jgi:hypothetical protein
MTPREIAQLIVQCRRLLACVIVARARDNERQAQLLLTEMDKITEQLPVVFRRERQLVDRIEVPVTRRVNRDGILDTSARLSEGRW